MKTEIFIFFILMINVCFSKETALFLKYCISARAAGMAECFASIADDINSINFNPAGLVNINGYENSTTYGIWFEDIYYLSFKTFIYVKKLKLAMDITYNNNGSINSYDELGNFKGSRQSNDWLSSISYAFKYKKNLNLGLNLKFIRQTIDKESIDYFAIDYGFLYKLNNKMQIAFVVQNLSNKVKFLNESFDLPKNLKIAFGYIENLKKFSFELNLNNNSQPYLNLGFEYLIKNNLSLRTGIKTKKIFENKDFSFLTFGIGVKNKIVNLDYALNFYKDLGFTNIFDLGFKF